MTDRKTKYCMVCGTYYEGRDRCGCLGAVTPPTDPRRPPSEELSWELLERVAGDTTHPHWRAAQTELLCRTIRSLCAERDEREREITRLALGQPAVEANRKLLEMLREREAQLSAYVTAAEGRPASELIAPSEVERKLAQLGAEIAAHGMEALEAKLAEQDAEIERLRAVAGWTCGCGHHNSMSLRTCAACNRPPGATR